MDGDVLCSSECWVEDGGGRIGGANCRLVRRVARLVEMTVVVS